MRYNVHASSHRATEQLVDSCRLSAPEWYRDWHVRSVLNAMDASEGMQALAEGRRSLSHFAFRPPLPQFL